MKVIIPNIIENGEKQFAMPYVEREANEKYFNTINDLKQYIFDNYCDETYEKLNKRTNVYDLKTYTSTQMVIQINKAIDDIETCILNNKINTCLKDDYKRDTNYKILFKYMDEYTKSKYENELNKLVEIHKSNLKQRNNFIKDNKDEIIEYLNTIKQNYINDIKNKKQEYIKNWRQKRNELLEITPRQKLTEEQKLANLKESQKKYYKKKCDEKAILEQQVQEIFKDEGLVPIIPKKKELTEKELKRKECNKKYYEKRKQLKQEL